jgi:cysteine dioxygenase
MPASSTVQHPKIAQFIEYFEGITTRPALEDVVQKLEALQISSEDLRAYIQFQGNQYHRNLIFENQYVQLLCLCWKSGHKSSIHDHANSSCAVKVIKGIITETVFEKNSEGYIKPVSTSHSGEGVIGSEDSDIHQITNLQDQDEDLITLHCYSPPLKRMQVFTTESNTSKYLEPFKKPC